MKAANEMVNSDLTGAVYTMEEALLSAGADQKFAIHFRNVVLPYRMRTDQVEALRKQVKLKRFGLFSEARVGKSISFAVACVYFAHWGVKSIVVSPPTLFLQLEELFKSIKGGSFEALVFDFSLAKRATALREWKEGSKPAPDILIMSKEIFKKELEFLLGLKYGNLVFDEAHMGLQSMKSHTYDAVSRFVSASNAQRLTVATGTPIPNEVEAAYPIISLVNPSAYQSRGQFLRKHVNYFPQQYGRRTVMKVVGYQNLDGVHNSLYANAHRTTKAEVLKTDVPNIQVVPVRLSAAHSRLYRRLLSDRVLEHEGTVINAIQAQKLRHTALQLITTPQDFGEVSGNAVIDLIKDLLSSVGAAEREKVVIFANYNRSVETLQDALENYNPAVVYGPGKDNAGEAERFKTDPSCRVLIANPVAGGVGLTLGGVSSTVIFAEPVSTPGQFDQACSRVMLVGKTEPVTVYIFDVKGTISPSAIKLMLRKGSEVKRANMDKKTLLDELLGEEVL